VLHPVGDVFGGADHRAVTAPGGQTPQKLAQGR